MGIFESLRKRRRDKAPDKYHVYHLDDQELPPELPQAPAPPAPPRKPAAPAGQSEQRPESERAPASEGPLPGRPGPEEKSEERPPLAESGEKASGEPEEKKETPKQTRPASKPAKGGGSKAARGRPLRTPRMSLRNDPFTREEKAAIFQENMDLVGLFRKGKLSKKEAMLRQRAAVEERLGKIQKRISTAREKKILDFYGYYFCEELEHAKEPKESKTAPEPEQG